MPKNHANIFIFVLGFSSFRSGHVTYLQVRVEINGRGKFRARKLNYVQPSQVVQVPYPLRLKASSRFKYFQTREQWKVRRITSKFLRELICLYLMKWNSQFIHKNPRCRSPTWSSAPWFWWWCYHWFSWLFCRRWWTIRKPKKKWKTWIWTSCPATCPKSVKFWHRFSRAAQNRRRAKTTNQSRLQRSKRKSNATTRSINFPVRSLLRPKYP